MTQGANKPFTQRMQVRSQLSEEDARVLDSIQQGAETRPPNDRLVDARENAAAFLLMDGWAYTFKVMRDGRRQIVRFLVPGDIANPHGLFEDASAFAVRTLTPVSVVSLGPEIWPRIAEPNPALARRLAWTLGDETTDAEHVVSLGRRNAYERIAHFLVRTWDRLATIGMVNGTHYRLPIKQEHLADYLGLSVVHVSRTLTQLREDGLARVERGTAKLDDPSGLMTAGDVRPVMPFPGLDPVNSGRAANVA
ncbi:cAMP-binding domain of CRP or a regulatory subunit of cAMP-dependent protein kinases [Limimonas halophila]|uniref:cAMP-binding domain of CRP or a regulatory subunit of cAMP-dependent protein kinases n=1 Tax=Limimonas halophila TaxID=1082479 RepID=A0A1G7MCL4_9PROT|nr:Crp/Fnr family transcriptional regulator [Limimonas halophila]SDF59483.1 cAMP-binding domain of CRP or a regulatory subunit of cAMP-dependent protein kinases [Limimonas halophila]